MIKYILILFIVSGADGSPQAVSTAPFQTRTACRAAIVEASRAVPGERRADGYWHYRIKGICVPNYGGDE